MSKLYKVVTTTTSIVCADSERHAEWEAECADDQPDMQRATEVHVLQNVPMRWRDAIPWGGDEEKTVREIIQQNWQDND